MIRWPAAAAALGSALAFALCFVPSGARAADPRLRWQTMQTPHFEVHYAQGEERLATKVARLAEEAHRRLVPLLEHEPSERCQIVISDDTDFSNGSATPLLYNTIRVFAVPPDPRSSLNDFDDFVSELIDHEYTHILHLDTVSGVPAVFNQIFGKLWIPNGAQPPWFIEGMATFAESETSGAGRIRSSQEEMMVRAQVLEGTFPRIDQLSNIPLRYPRAANWYTLGGRFLTWIGQRYGLGALRELSHEYGGRALPLAINLNAAHVLGKSLIELFAEFRADESAQAEAVVARVRAAGETRAEPLTALGETVSSPRFGFAGDEVYYASAGVDRRPEIRALPLGPRGSTARALRGPTQDGDRALTQTFGEPRLAVDPSNAHKGSLVYVGVEIFQQFNVLEDLHRFDPATGRDERLTRGLRASEPDVAPDGTIAFVWRRPGGRTAIATLRPPETEPRVWFEDAAGEPVGSPRWSPDGARLAFLHHRGGSWDLRLIDRAGATQDVTHDRAIERDPSFSPDGRYLLFSSDRDGIFDLYAHRFSDGALLRVTHVVLGAFEPAVSPRGEDLVYVSYSSRGTDLARIPYEPARWEIASDERPLAASRPALAAPVPSDLFPVGAYSPWSTLRPHFWLPFLATDPRGTILGAYTSGSDVVGLHSYAGSVWTGFGGGRVGTDLAYSNHQLYPTLTARFSSNVTHPAGTGSRAYLERQIAASFAATFPFTDVARGQAVTVAYELTHFGQKDNPAAVRVPTGFLGAAVFQYSYSDARRFTRSVSSEEGQRFTLGLRVADPALGGAFAFQQLTASVSRYLALPWAAAGRPLHHALALRLAGGVGRGDLAARRLYSLGGFDIGDPVSTLLNPVNAPVRVLRGFLSGAFEGEAYALASAEYRFPIVDIEAGAWTLPLYLRRLHGAVFTDAGDAFTPGQHDFLLHAGAGAELRAELLLGYALPTDLRLGCAHGLPRRTPGGDPATLDCYAALGGEF